MVMPYRLIGDGHKHTPNDGRGMRKVFLDGAEVKRVVYANTYTGEVVFLPESWQVDGSGNIITETRFGKVEVVFL